MNEYKHFMEWKITRVSGQYLAEDQVEKFVWIQDPFRAQAPQDFTTQEEEDLIDLSTDSSLWVFSGCGYKEQISLENKCGKRMRAVSSLIPRFEKLCSELQAHPSH